MTQNLPVLSNQSINAANNFDAVFNLSQGPPHRFPRGSGERPFPASERIGRARPRLKQQLPTVDAWNATVQHQLTDTLSVEAGYVGNRGSHGFIGTPCGRREPAIIVGSRRACRPTSVDRSSRVRGQRQGFGGAYGWTQSFDYFCNCATNLYHSLQTKATKRFSGATRSWRSTRYSGRKTTTGVTTSSIPT